MQERSAAPLAVTSRLVLTVVVAAVMATAIGCGTSDGEDSQDRADCTVPFDNATWKSARWTPSIPVGQEVDPKIRLGLLQPLVTCERPIGRRASELRKVLGPPDSQTENGNRVPVEWSYDLGDDGTLDNCALIVSVAENRRVAAVTSVGDCVPSIRLGPNQRQP